MEYKKQFNVYSIVYISVFDGLYNKLIEVTYANISGPIYKVLHGLLDRICKATYYSQINKCMKTNSINIKCMEANYIELKRYAIEI